MKFALHFKNCGEGEFIEDFLLVIRFMLESLGHEVRYEYDLGAPADCHVIVEHFDEMVLEAMRHTSQRGSQWIIMASEYVTGATFNDYPNLDDSKQYADVEHWKKRYEMFVRCAEYARAVWLSIEDPVQVAAYRAILPPHVQVVPLEFPFCPQLMPSAPPPERDIDVLFTGTQTPHRVEILERLVPHMRLFATRYMPDYLRREFISRSKISVAIRQAMTWPYPSQLRMWGQLTRGGFVLAERCPFVCRLERYVALVESSQYVEAVIALLRSGQCEQLRHQLITQFADEYPCKPAARNLLDQSFANLA